METKKSIVVRFVWRDGSVGGAQDFRAMKLLCMILYWWVHYTFVKTHKCTTVKPNVKYGLCLIMMCQCWLIVGLCLITNVPHGKMLMMREALCFGGLGVGVEYVGMTQQPHVLVLTQMI